MAGALLASPGVVLLRLVPWNSSLEASHHLPSPHRRGTWWQVPPHTEVNGSHLAKQMKGDATCLTVYNQRSLPLLFQKTFTFLKKNSWLFYFIQTLYNCSLCSVTRLCLTLCNPMDCSTPGFPVLSFPISWSLLKHMSIESMMPSNHLILCHSSCLQSPSIRVFSNELVLHIRWPKFWSFSNRLISFRIDWFDLLAVQGTLKSFL